MFEAFLAALSLAPSLMLRSTWEVFTQINEGPTQDGIVLEPGLHGLGVCPW